METGEKWKIVENGEIPNINQILIKIIKIKLFVCFNFIGAFHLIFMKEIIFMIKIKKKKIEPGGKLIIKKIKI